MEVCFGQPILGSDWLYPTQSVEADVYGKDEIKKALRVLESQERDSLILHDLQGYSYREISERFGRSVKVVENVLQRARRKMRATLMLNSILVDVLIEPASPSPGHLTEIAIRLNNIGHRDATEVVIEVDVEDDKLGRSIVDVPRQIDVKVEGFVPWLSRLGEYSVNVTLSISGQTRRESHNTLWVKKP